MLELSSPTTIMQLSVLISWAKGFKLVCCISNLCVKLSRIYHVYGLTRCGQGVCWLNKSRSLEIKEGWRGYPRDCKMWSVKIEEG